MVYFFPALARIDGRARQLKFKREYGEAIYLPSNAMRPAFC
jgi:hypothetical protein